MMYQRMKNECERLQIEINKLQRKIDALPQGKLICTKNGNYYRWYKSDGHEKEYIHRSDRKLAEQLALKKYYLAQIEEYEQEKLAIEFYLRHHVTEMAETQKIWQHPAYQELLRPNFLPQEGWLQEWTNGPYERNPYHPEGLIHRTISGEMVRSKSEAMIAYILYTNHIPFRYECALHLGESTVYPDFSVMSMSMKKEIYWEHFGRMDDPIYAKSAGTKLQQYFLNGIIPGDQLITTYETKENPLSIETIENIVQEYFL